MNITTPFTSGNGHDDMWVNAVKRANYFHVKNDNGASIALYKPAIPQLIEVLQRIHNGESV